jgi:phenylalanyl-tRNA synthetase beta chain
VTEHGAPANQLMALEVRDATLCPRYTARVIRDVTIGPAPQWMADRLTLAGMRPINNVVDITNYVMLELGQPLHAFDYDKVAEHRIIVRRAEPGERITTLDGVTRDLTPEMLLITDPAGPTVIAGIFGGARCEVGEGTTNVLLEAAHFNPTNIRRTSQAIGLRTESSGRFEKNPDVALTAVAIDRAAQLIAELAGGTVAPGRVDFYPEPPTQRELRFDSDQVEWLTGMRVTSEEVITALRALGFTVTPEADSRYLRVIVPTWRADVVESADLVEEVARIVGYERIPTTIPIGPLPKPERAGWFEREDRVREALVGAGLTEVITYALTNRQMLARLLVDSAPGAERLLNAPASVLELEAGAPAESVAPRARGEERRQIEAIAERLAAITLRNPLSSEMDTMRLTLMAGLLTTLYENSKYSDAGLWFFELGRRYLPTPELTAGTGLAQERRTLGVALLGPATRSWDAPARPADFYDIKGVAETLLGALQITAYRFLPVRHPTFHPGRCATLEVLLREDGEASAPGEQAVAPAAAWQRVGVLGEVHPEVAARFELTGRAYLMELDLERLFDATAGYAQHSALPPYPAVQRDLAVVVARDVPEIEVREALRTAGGALLREARLFDVYTGEAVGQEQKSLAYALVYQSPERTLTDADVEAVQARILAALGERFGATLRA